MRWKIYFFVVVLAVGISGNAIAQYSNTPAGQNYDAKILGHTPADLQGRTLQTSSGESLGKFEGIVRSGPSVFGVVSLLNKASRHVVSLTEFRIDREGRMTTSLSAEDIASKEKYESEIGYQEVAGDDMTVGDAVSSFD
ncbi:hypothetical protein SAE02_75320 [Skermanella aerolata]|uniref:PRC-barrel domain-containing protein n=1 Tax=Skermanella aerolata TaxID=393310 RepID=A0A512E3T1_9PROT|nr:hypothetical protein [Skermanella aerolata]KJB90233.1 hypothetical protein N826_04485 [Skermanella aerolata KACC 11604]GEO43384.1 hypothetical protein SAE02_75320 [Skermanella aerolata]